MVVETCRVGLVVAFMFIVTVARFANAEPAKDGARLHFSRGIELFDEGSYREAVIEFKRAYEIQPHYAVLYNLGQVYVALASAVEAVDALERYLVEGGSAIPGPRRVQTEEQIARQKTRIALLTLEVEPAGALISIDGEEVGQSPLRAPLRLGIGTHRIVISHEGFSAVQRSVTLAGEERATIEVRLSPLPAAKVRPPIGHLLLKCPHAGASVLLDGRTIAKSSLDVVMPVDLGWHDVTFEVPGRSPETRQVRVQEELTMTSCEATGGGSASMVPRRSRTLAYGIGAVGVAMLATTAGVYVWNDARHGSWSREDAVLREDVMDWETRRVANNALLDSIHRADLVTIVTASAGLAAVGTAAFLLMRPERRHTVAFVPDLRAGGAVAMWRSQW